MQRLKLNDELYAVEVFFNGLSDGRYAEILSEVAEGYGYDIDYAECSLPKGLAEEYGGQPENYGYVEFIAGDDSEAKVSFSDFLDYATKASKVQIARYPEQRSTIVEALERLRLELRTKT